VGKRINVVNVLKLATSELFRTRFLSQISAMSLWPGRRKDQRAGISSQPNVRKTLLDLALCLLGITDFDNVEKSNTEALLRAGKRRFSKLHPFLANPVLLRPHLSLSPALFHLDSTTALPDNPQSNNGPQEV
jgi:hypothetical protein